MSYALSEDLVLPLGRALAEGSVEPFPYREDVSVGLYLLQLARRGEVGSVGRIRLLGQVRVVPHQRKDAMPLAAGPMQVPSRMAARISRSTAGCAASPGRSS